MRSPPGSAGRIDLWVVPSRPSHRVSRSLNDLGIIVRSVDVIEDGVVDVSIIDRCEEITQAQ